jgi:hypothetical protein
VGWQREGIGCNARPRPDFRGSGGQQVLRPGGGVVNRPSAGTLPSNRPVAGGRPSPGANRPSAGTLPSNRPIAGNRPSSGANLPSAGTLPSNRPVAGGRPSPGANRARAAQALAMLLQQNRHERYQRGQHHSRRALPRSKGRRTADRSRMPPRPDARPKPLTTSAIAASPRDAASLRRAAAAPGGAWSLAAMLARLCRDTTIDDPARKPF